jgi:GDP-4-dehydro-6-deoxy-D-mannose reductase
VKALITGGGGFVGSHLAELLLAEGMEVCALVRSLENTGHLPTRQPSLSIAAADVRREDSVRRVVQDAAPDRIYHLAAYSEPRRSLQEPLPAYQTNLTGTWNVLDAARSLSRLPRSLCVSSGQVYDAGACLGALSESAPIKPETPYSASKLCAEIVAAQYHATWDLPAVVVRPFNCIGPRQSPSFVCSNFAKQMVEISLGIRPAIVRVGNLSQERDFTDVRDAVRAFALVLERGKPGEAYNVCSGTLHSIREVIDTLAEIAKLKITVETDAARMRAVDQPRILGDASKLNRDTGWQPEISFRQSLKDLIEYWHKRIAVERQIGAR